MKKKTTRAPVLRRNDPIGAYLNEIGQIPLLTQEQEITLSKKAKQGDKEAREKLILANMRLVVNVAKQYASPSFPSLFLDLVQEGNVGLIEAVERFNPQKGTRFSTYAVYWIHHEILNGLEKVPDVRIPRHLITLGNKIKRIKDSYLDQSRKVPENEEIAKTLGVSLASVERALSGTGYALSLDKPLKEEGEKSLLEFIADPTTSTVDQKTKEILFVFKGKLLKAMEEILRPEEREILSFRFGLDGYPQITYREIGSYFNLSKQRIRQIEKSAIKKLRKYFDEKDSELKKARKIKKT